MAGKRRWVKKGAPKKKGWKKTGKTRKVNRSELLNEGVVCKSIKHLGMVFPDRLCTKMKFSQQLTLTGTTNKAFGVGGNFLHDANTLIITGANPFSNAIFNQNLEIQGINLLIGDPNSNVGIYNTYRVNSSSCDLRISAYATSAHPQVAPCYVACYPATGESLGATSLGDVNTWNVLQFREYPLAKVVQVSEGMDNGVRLRNKQTTAKMFGLKYKSSLEDSNYYAQYGSNPEYLWMWVIAVLPDTTADTYTVEILHTTEYEIEFFDRNVLAVGLV